METDKKRKRNSLIFSLGFHGLILLLFALYGLTYPVPRPEQGILINFGNSSEGSGEIQPDQLTEPTSAETDIPSETTPNPSNSASEVEEVLTSQEAPIEVEKTKTEKTEKTKTEPTETPITEKPKEIDDRLKQTLQNAFQKTGGGSEGNDQDKIGDKGALDGSKQLNNYSGGGGGGNGMSFSLDGRSVLSVPKIEDQSQDEGRVVVDIKVDRKGNVISAIAGVRGSTTTSSNLLSKAKEAALKTKFSPNPTGPVEQRGQITFSFILE